MTPGGPITSRHNPRVRALARLRDRRERDATGLVLVDGARETARALAARVPIREAVVAWDLLRSGEGEGAVAALEAAGVPILPVGPDAFERLAFGDRRDGVVAVAEPARLTLRDLSLRPAPLVAVLERLEKPGNLGAIARSADAAGVHAILVVDGVTDVYHPNAIRGSLGAIFALPVVAAVGADAAAWLRERGVAIVAAIVDAERAPWDVDLTGSTALALGSEANGLGPAWRGSEVASVTLPMRGVGDSLNVSAAAAVLFYEARRQRDAWRGRAGAPEGLG